MPTGTHDISDKIVTRGGRLLGLPPESIDARKHPSCVLLQIDGLSYADFRMAIAGGKLPFLALCLENGNMLAGSWKAMLPTSTSAFQSGLFYADNDDIPGFFWYDKRSGRRMRMNSISGAADVEQHLRDRVKPFEGLLKNGSAYSSIFTGGAANTLLTFSRLFHPRLNLGTRPRWIFNFLASQILLFLRVGYYAAIELLLAVYDLVRGVLSEKNKFLEFKFLFARIVSVVICREISTLAAILDIRRGVGPIFINFFAYDEHAHHRGPTSRFAYWTLKGIDGAIRRISKAVSRAAEQGVRRYDVYVWSDHGQVPTIPFQELFEQTPERHFDLLFRTGSGAPVEKQSATRSSQKKQRLPRGYFVKGQKGRQNLWRIEHQARQAETIRQLLPRTLHRIYAGLLRTAIESAGAEESRHGLDAGRSLEVVSTGPVAHLYYLAANEPVTYEFWRKRFPQFIDQMALHGGVGFILVRTRASGAMVGLSGHWFDIADNQALDRYGSELVIGIIRRHRKELIRWSNMPSAGDLILLGQRSSEDLVISYSYERGGHAGASPRETTPFIMVPGEKADQWAEITAAWPDERLTLNTLHNRLRCLYGSTGGDPDPL